MSERGRVGLVLGSGAAGMEAGGSIVAVDRHGDPYTLPHLVDHEANLGALAEAGCDRILGVASVGGLRAELAPGTFLVPHDFIALDLPPFTTRPDAEAHRVAGFDPEWRSQVLDAVATHAEVLDGGVYWQVAGPRLETPAEVRFIAAHADVVGMTVASECIVAGELGLRYAALCMVDNLANGIAAEKLTLDEVDAGQRRHRAELARVLDAVLAGLAV